MRPSFANLLERYLARAELSQRQFSRLVGVDQSFLSLLIAGKRLPTLEALPAWMDALKVPAGERDEFIFAAALERTPTLVRERLERLEAENQRLRVRTAKPRN